MNVLIAMGGFKDVSPAHKAPEIVKESLERLNLPSLHIRTMSLSDGGEDSIDVLLKNNVGEVRTIDNIVDPTGQVRSVRYLALNDGSVYLSSSEILRLKPNQDQYKNPLLLTSYGLGQALHFIDQAELGKPIVLGLGGTSTADGGIGMLSAMNWVFRDECDRVIDPSHGNFFCAQDLHAIMKIESPPHHAKTPLLVLNDARANLGQISTPTKLKVGKLFEHQKTEIVDRVIDGIRHLAKLTLPELAESEIDSLPYGGVAGGLNWSLKLHFNCQMKLGADFFFENCGLKEMLERSDVVITGEGRLDNSFQGKAPIRIAQAAKKLGKPVIYLAGSIDPTFNLEFDGMSAINLPSIFSESGITYLLSDTATAGKPDCRNDVTYLRQRLPLFCTEALKLVSLLGVEK